MHTFTKPSTTRYGRNFASVAQALMALNFGKLVSGIEGLEFVGQQ
jgi:hypothetical protein